jgi:hypothetical protein
MAALKQNDTRNGTTEVAVGMRSPAEAPWWCSLGEIGVASALCTDGSAFGRGDPPREMLAV